jgi:hypothetical protein
MALRRANKGQQDQKCQSTVAHRRMEFNLVRERLLPFPDAAAASLVRVNRPQSLRQSRINARVGMNADIRSGGITIPESVLLHADEVIR